MNERTDPQRRQQAEDLAAVQRSNRVRLGDLSRDSGKLREETQALLAETRSIVDPVLFEEARIPISENALPAPAPCTGWDDCVLAAKSHLQTLGFDQPKSMADLLTAEENERVSDYLARPIYDRIPWDISDLSAAFAVGIAGAAVDVLLGTPGAFVQKAMADKKHWLGSWMESVHAKAPDGAPIDYQGPHFGGGYHRGLTTGHDLLRPLEGIRQFKDGVFRGFYFKDGVKHVVESGANQFDKPYCPMSWGEAVLAWLIHNACDFFSTNSLPIPGTSWFYELPNRDARVFVQKNLYQNGINLRHLTLQTLAPLVVEVGIGTYAAVRYRHLNAPPEAMSQKRKELLVLSHTLTTAVNLGKITFLQDPTMLNVPELLALLRAVLGLLTLELRRNSFIEKISRNAFELRETQADIEHMLHLRFPHPVILR